MSIGTITTAEVDGLAALTGSRDAALTALLERLAYDPKGGVVATADIKVAEQALAEQAFAGGLSEYLAELEQRAVDRAVVRDVIAGQFRQQAAEALLAVEKPGLPAARWAKRRKKDGYRTAICLRDELPRIGRVDWSNHGQFLELPEATVSIRARPGRGQRGASVTLLGRVSSLRSYEVVQVYALRPGDRSFRRIGSAEVDRDGGWSLGIVPSSTTTYRALSRSAVSPPLVLHAA
jgi:hypothetical protein